MGQLAGTNRKPALIVRVVDGLGGLLEKKNTYQVSNEDLNKAQNIYTQKLLRYGDLNKDNIITLEEQKIFDTDIAKYKDFRTKNYKGKMPKNHTKESYKLAIKWRKEYNPNWRGGKK